MTQTLEQLSAAATQGEWVADNHVIMLSPATTVACLENFNQWGDSKPTGNEANDAAFICQLVNAYRTGQLVAVQTEQPTCMLCAGKCRGHSLADSKAWEPEPGSQAFAVQDDANVQPARHL